MIPQVSILFDITVSNFELKCFFLITDSLITPDLWLKNCRSRSQSPISELSRTPSPHKLHPTYPKLTTPLSISQTNENLIKKPIITVAPVSKLLNKNLASKQSLRSVKRRRLRACRPNTSMSIHNIASAETNNNNHKNLNIQEMPRLRQKIPQETNESHPVRIAPPPHVHPQPNFRPSHPLFRPPPPVTVLVPYPIILPIVIPIPIILPILKPIDLKKDETKIMCSNDAAATSTSKCKTESIENKLHEESVDTEKLEDDEHFCTKGELNKDENAEHKLPKFKITRLSSKRIMTRECEKEKNRPLRKRKFDHHQIIELDDDKSKSK